jgi:hypothetical protein
LRLVGLGPRLLPLVIMAVTTMGLSGMIVGLVLGLVPNRTRKAGSERAARDAEPRNQTPDRAPPW